MTVFFRFCYPHPSKTIETLALAERLRLGNYGIGQSVYKEEVSKDAPIKNDVVPHDLGADPLCVFWLRRTNE